MPRAKPDEPQVVVSFRVKQSGDDWVRAEAKRRGVSRTEMYRELMRLGVSQIQRAASKPRTPPSGQSGMSPSRDGSR